MAQSGVDAFHPLYKGELYKVVRDCCEDESHIKALTETYLRMTNSQNMEDAGKACSGAIEAYAAYLSRARFPDIVNPTANGFVGIAHKNASKIELPTSMEYLIDDVGGGIKLAKLEREVTGEVLRTGRNPLITDSRVGDEHKVSILSYRAESLINWRGQSEQGSELPSLIVLHEKVLDSNQTNMYEHAELNRYRVLYLEDGVLKSKTITTREDTGEEVEEEQEIDFGYPIIPVAIASSTGKILDPDILPMLPIARNAIAAYQISADYRQALYMSAMSTPYVTGFSDKEDSFTGVGPGHAIIIGEPTGTVGFLETDGKGIDKMREAIKMELDEATENGHKILEKTGRESGEALKTRLHSKQATLKSVVINSANAIEQSLKYAAMWMGIDTEKVSYKPNMHFIDDEIDPQLLAAIDASIDSAHTPIELHIEYLQRKGFTDKTIDAYKELLNNEDNAKFQVSENKMGDDVANNAPMEQTQLPDG